MALLKGNDLTGLIGPLVLKKGNGGRTIVQTKAREYKQNKESKRSAKMFGYGSSVAGAIRRELHSTIGMGYDPGMVNRFNTPVRAVLNHCWNKQEGAFKFEQDSFNRLAEFEFNIKSPLINFLWVKPTMTLEANTLKVTIPAFEVPSQFTFPRGTNVCNVTVTISQINITQAITKYELYFAFEVTSDQQSHPAREFEFAVENECLCIAAIGLSYTQRYEGRYYSFQFQNIQPCEYH